MADSVISVEYKGRIATITISNEKKLNALNQQQYYEIAKALREIATHDEVYITVLLAKGRFFSAYACLSHQLLSLSFRYPALDQARPLPPARLTLALSFSLTLTHTRPLSSFLQPT